MSQQILIWVFVVSIGLIAGTLLVVCGWLYVGQLRRDRKLKRAIKRRYSSFDSARTKQW